MGVSLRNIASTCGSFARSLYGFYVDGQPRPFSASFSIIDSCNLRCEYCNAPYMPNGGGMPLADVERVLDRLYAIGIRRLGLTGGEPLMRKDCGTIIAGAKARGFFVSVNSNLQLYRRYPTALDPVDVVMTSIDGEEALHEDGRGKGSFRGVLDAVRDLRERGKTVVAICVVRDESLDQLDQALGVATSLGIRIHFQPRSVDCSRSRGTLDDEVTNQRRRAAWTYLLERKHAGAPVASSAFYLEHMTQWEDFSASTILDPGRRCAAGHGFLWVDAHGKAYPCGFIEGRVEGVSLLGDEWEQLRLPEPPCSNCTVGPYVELNELFRHPMRAPLAAARTYLARH